MVRQFPTPRQKRTQVFSLAGDVPIETAIDMFPQVGTRRSKRRRKTPPSDIFD